MLALFGLMAVIYGGVNVVEVLSSDDPVVFDGNLVLSLVVAGIGLVALMVDRLLDIKEASVEAQKEANAIAAQASAPAAPAAPAAPSTSFEKR